MRERAIEATHIPRSPLDVLAQQIVAMVAIEDWSVGDLERVVKSAYPYEELSEGQIENVLDMLDGRYPSEEFAELRPRLAWDRIEGTLRARRGRRSWRSPTVARSPTAACSECTCRTAGAWASSTRRWSTRPAPGRRSASASTTWRIEEITRDRVIVTPAPEVPGAIPFWKGDGIGRSYELGEAIGDFQRELAEMPESKAKVTPPTGGTITNTASVAGNGSIDPNSANDSASAETAVGSVTDLSVTNADSPDPATVGKTLTYAIKVRNNGASNATGVTLTDPLPATVNFVSATAKKGICFQSVPGTVVCSIGSIGIGASVDLQIKVTPQIAGTITNTATVQSNQVDSNPANDSASATTTVNPSADLAITKSVSPSTPHVGNTMVYTLAIQNNGPSPATGVTATDPLPTGYVAYQSVSSSQGSCSQASGKVTCALGSLSVGGTASVTINVTAIRDGGTDNKATVKGNEGDPVGGNNSSSVHSDIINR